MNDEEKVINSTILNQGVAKPINISKEEAVAIAKEQASTNDKENSTRFAEIKQVTREEIDLEKVNELNDLMKNDYVKLVDRHHSIKTYIILISIFILLIAVIIFEIIYFQNKF